MDTNERVIVLDPHPRTIDLIFGREDWARLERLGRVVRHDGSPAPDEHVERYLSEAVAIVGQTPLPRERLERAPHLRLVANVEGNFLPT
jgi:phosphoglycerate dehydrogenase-like enzyme